MYIHTSRTFQLKLSWPQASQITEIHLFVSLLWMIFSELPISRLLYEMATTKPCKIIRQTW